MIALAINEQASASTKGTTPLVYCGFLLNLCFPMMKNKPITRSVGGNGSRSYYFTPCRAWCGLLCCSARVVQGQEDYKPLVIAECSSGVYATRAESVVRERGKEVRPSPFLRPCRFSFTTFFPLALYLRTQTVAVPEAMPKSPAHFATLPYFSYKRKN